MTHQNFWHVLKSKKAMKNVFTDQNFDQEVLGSEKPVVVDFWAPWCGPCQMMGPIVSQLAKDLGNDVKVGKLNVDENPQMAQIFRDVYSNHNNFQSGSGKRTISRSARS